MKRTLAITACVTILTGAFALAGAPSDDVNAELDAAKKRATEVRHVLRYKFKKGEVLRWKVVHLGTTETTIQGNTQTTKSRSVSTKRWTVSDIDESGNISLTYSVVDVSMWQQLSDRPEIRYDSRTDNEVPPEYAHVAKTIGIPLTTVTVAPDGSVIKRESRLPQSSFGLGDMVMLLPPKPVKNGSTWYEPAEIRVRLPDGSGKRIKIRKLYRLEKVQTGVATISVKTEVLTPVNNPKIEVQLVQQVNNGTIKFDIDAGRITSKQMDWDESVVGFNGADSLMKYLARITEESLEGEDQSVAAADSTTPPTVRATRSDKPAVRRR